MYPCPVLHSSKLPNTSLGVSRNRSFGLRDEGKQFTDPKRPPNVTHCVILHLGLFEFLFLFTYPALPVRPSTASFASLSTLYLAVSWGPIYKDLVFVVVIEELAWFAAKALVSVLSVSTLWGRVKDRFDCGCIVCEEENLVDTVMFFNKMSPWF